MKGQTAFEALSGVRDDLIEEAVELLGLLDMDAASVGRRPRRERGESLFSRFMDSSWGVALLCAVVSLSVLSAIVWAGNRPPVGGPAGPGTDTEARTESNFISEEEAVAIAAEYWGIQSGDTDPATGFVYRIEPPVLTQLHPNQPPRYYSVELRRTDESSEYILIDYIMIDAETGQVLIRYAESDIVDEEPARTREDNWETMNEEES